MRGAGLDYARLRDRHPEHTPLKLLKFRLDRGMPHGYSLIQACQDADLRHLGRALVATFPVVVWMVETGEGQVAP